MPKQTTVRLPDELADEAEAVARVKGTSVNQLIIDSLSAEIERVRADDDFNSDAISNGLAHALRVTGTGSIDTGDGLPLYYLEIVDEHRDVRGLCTQLQNLLGFREWDFDVALIEIGQAASPTTPAGGCSTAPST